MSLRNIVKQHPTFNAYYWLKHETTALIASDLQTLTQHNVLKYITAWHAKAD